MDESPLHLVSEIGDHLGRLTRPNKDFLVKSLRVVSPWKQCRYGDYQAASALSQIEQPLSPEASKKIEAVKKLEAATKPLTKSILKHGLLRHTDKDVKLLVAICVSEVFRILAPEPPFEDKYLRDVFKLILSMFVELADTASPYFSRRVKILETVARCKCCVIMLDIDCNDLVLEMFNIFFCVVREHHQQSLITDILSIMTHILNEEVSQALLDLILRNLIKEGKPAPPAASQLAVSVIQTCEEKLEPFVCGFLSSCSLDMDAVESDLKEFYHDILFKIFQCAPQMLLAVIPNLTRELMTDQVDVRIKAVNLIGRLFALPERHVAQKYRNLFIEFKNRFSDKSVEVRLSALQCAKACYMANPSGIESHEVLAALEGRLLDFDDRVRTRAVVVACDLARSNLKIFSPELIARTTERLRDKKISVRKKALQKLMEVYRDYCNKCSEGHMMTSDHIEQIPCKILMLCYDKDCKEFRSQSMDLILAEDLFPVLLSAEDRTRHWIHFFSLFSPLHMKALNSIMSQKRRLQTEMRIYLALRKKEKDTSSEEMQKRIKNSFMKMSASFPDPSKAEDSFHKLDQMKDNKIFNSLELLLDNYTFTNSRTTRDKFLKIIGDGHPDFEFLQLLSSKCSSNIFGAEHVRCILDHLSSNRIGNVHSEASSAVLLQAIISSFPSLLRGSEEQFLLILKQKNTINDTLIEALAKAGPHISVKFSDFYPFLERICIKGTRAQSKHAVSAIASLLGSSEHFIFSKLCKKLVDSLHSGWNTPTILQSLGCIAQHSASAFETHDEEIRSYIFNRIFQVEESEDPISSHKTPECSDSCKLKICGLKTLVKSFLPHRGSHVKRQMDELLEILSKMLQTGDAFDGITSCASDKPHIRLAAAKSVLRLSRRWDLHIYPEIFRFTILMAKDSSFVRRLFLDKTHKLLKEHVIPIRYACAFAMAASDHCKDLQDASFKYMEEFIKEYSREARARQTSAMQGGSLTDYPAYIVVFLIHVLAYDTGFPSDGCQDEQVYARFCRPLFWVVQAMLNASVVNGDMDIINNAVLYLLSIFRAIRKAEDAVDAQGTPKLHMLAEIGISVLNALNHNGMSSAHAPGMILLPASLYRISPVKKCDEGNSKFTSHFPIDESFIKRVVHIFKSQILAPASTLPKHGRKCQEDVIQASDVKCNTLNSSSCEHFDLLTKRTTEMKKTASQEISLGRRRKHACSLTASESEGLQNGHSAIVVCHAAKRSKPLLEKEQHSSSCDSAMTIPSLTESQVSIQKLDRIVSSLKENTGASSDITVRSSKSSRAKLKEHCSLRISHDSEDVGLLCLDSESSETIRDSSLAEKENMLEEESQTFRSSQCNPMGCSSLNNLKEMVQTCGDGATKQPKCLAGKESGRFSKRMPSFPAEGKNGQKVLSDTTPSDVVNIIEDAVTRRTRRQKE